MYKYKYFKVGGKLFKSTLMSIGEMNNDSKLFGKLLNTLFILVKLEFLHNMFKLIIFSGIFIVSSFKFLFFWVIFANLFLF